VIHLYKEILLSKKKEQTIDIYNNKNESPGIWPNFKKCKMALYCMIPFIQHFRNDKILLLLVVRDRLEWGGEVGRQWEEYERLSEESLW
jgi:hypothetical protein